MRQEELFLYSNLQRELRDCSLNQVLNHILGSILILKSESSGVGQYEKTAGNMQSILQRILRGYSQDPHSNPAIPVKSEWNQGLRNTGEGIQCSSDFCCTLMTLFPRGYGQVKPYLTKQLGNPPLPTTQLFQDPGDKRQGTKQQQVSAS